MDFGRTLAAVLVRDSIPLLEIEPYTSGAVNRYCPIPLLIRTLEPSIILVLTLITLRPGIPLNPGSCCDNSNRQTSGG